MPQARTLKTAKTSRKCWKMVTSQRKVNWVQVSLKVSQVNQQHRPQKEQRPLLRKHHQILPPTDPQTGPSKESPEAPTEAPTEDPTQTPGEEKIELTNYVKAHRAAGKAWLDTVVEQKETAYDTLYDKLQQLGGPHIQKFDEADREQVYNCIRDRTGRFLTQDEFVLYVETEDKIEKPKYMFTGDAREALKDYYDAVHTLCEAQTNFARSTQVLEQKIEDKSVFLSIIQQVQLPMVQVQVRTVEEMEKLEGKTYRELTLLQHLPNFRAIYPNTTEQTRTMAAYIYFILYEQITGLKPSQTGCSTDFRKEPHSRG